jgi:hypothetical protein
MPRRVKSVTAIHDSLRRALKRSWWVLFPCFLVLVLRLTVERTCSDPYDLLPALASNPVWGWPIAIVYVTSHAWLLGVYLLTAASVDSLVPSRLAFRSMWRAEYMKVLLMAGAFLLEYLPVTIWRLVGTALHCAG